MSILENAKQSAKFIRERLPGSLQQPKIAIICGSGLGGLGGLVEEEEKTVFDYKDIPNFPVSTVPGHAGKLVCGKLAGVPSILMVGRAHFYEGHTMAKITFPVRVFKQLGIDTIIVTNAAGGLNPDYKVGDIMLLSDHLFLAGLMGSNPLVGPNDDALGTRFPPMSDAYDLELRRTAHRAWKKIRNPEAKRELREGVYAFTSGPFYESRAESMLIRLMGADTVGMSTIPEVQVARHGGMRALAISLVTNSCALTPIPKGDEPRLQDLNTEQLAAILNEGRPNHEEVLEAGRDAAVDLQNLVKQLVFDIFNPSS